MCNVNWTKQQPIREFLWKNDLYDRRPRDHLCKCAILRSGLIFLQRKTNNFSESALFPSNWIGGCSKKTPKKKRGVTYPCPETSEHPLPHFDIFSPLTTSQPLTRRFKTGLFWCFEFLVKSEKKKRDLTCDWRRRDRRRPGRRQRQRRRSGGCSRQPILCGKLQEENVLITHRRGRALHLRPFP